MRTKRLHLPTLLICLAFSVALLGVVGGIAHQSYQARAQLEGETKLYQLGQAIFACENATSTMEGIIRADEVTPAAFQEMAQRLIAEHPTITALRLAPAGKATNDYAYQASGAQSKETDLFQDPLTRKEAAQARDDDRTTIVGPFEDADGRQVIAIWEPVTVNVGSGPEFWGFAIAFVSLDSLEEDANFASMGKFGYSYLLTIGSGAHETTLSGSMPNRAVAASEELGNMRWNLYVAHPVSMVGVVENALLAFALYGASFLASMGVASNRRLAHLNVTDPLTGLLNRRGFDRRLDRALADMVGTGDRLVLLAIDVDTFKVFNDLYGHANGDVLLQRLADELRELVGGKGAIARNGGDEFQALLPCPGEDWRERLDAFAAQQHAFFFDGREYWFNVSVGSAVYPDQAEEASDLCRKADAALYQAKLQPNGAHCTYAEGMLEGPRSQIGFNFRDLAGGVPGSVLIYRADGDEQILYANDACVELFGCGSFSEFMQVTGGSFKTLVYPEDAAWAERTIEEQQSVPENDHNDWLAYRIVTKDGTVRQVVDQGRLIHHEYFGDLYFVLLISDEHLDMVKRRGV